MWFGGGAMSHVTPADVACDIAQALCDVARAAAARCSDVVRCGAPTPATFSRARGEVATSHPPWATSPHRPRAGGEVATSPRPYAMSLATLLVGRGRAITKESSMFPPPPCGRPCLSGDVAMSPRQSAMSLGRLGLGGEVATSHRPCAMSHTMLQVRCCDVVRCGPPIPATFSRARDGRATSHPPKATSPHRPRGRGRGDVAMSPPLGATSQHRQAKD